MPFTSHEEMKRCYPLIIILAIIFHNGQRASFFNFFNFYFEKFLFLRDNIGSFNLLSLTKQRKYHHGNKEACQEKTS